VFGLAGGLMVGLGGVSGQLLVAEEVLAISGHRVRFIRFLEMGLDRQVLRQAGAVYQFRHADLQDRLAERFAHDHLRTGVPATSPTQVGQDPDRPVATGRRLGQTMRLPRIGADYLR
jgi:hypothetical protein